MQQAIDILSELEKELEVKRENKKLYDPEKIDCAIHYIWIAKSHIQALWDGWNEMISKNIALEFADWYHNWLLNSERRDVEEEFKKFCIVKFTPV